MTIPRTAIQPPDPAGVLPGPETARGFFQLAPEIHFLNHGSFGALPRSVQEAQDHWRARIEAHPIKLLGRECPDLLKEALGPVADLVGARRDELCFVTNATEGINALLRSMEFAPGDELLTTNHVYNAIRQAMKYRARETGGSYVEVDVPLPIASEQQILDVIMSAVTDRTRLLIIDHITSPTAIVFPIEQLVSMARQRGIRIIIDGAHGPGMVPLELDSLGADAYVANLHKWICAPKGCAFMWVAPEHQGSVHPATISHYLDDGYFDEFSWQGTRDITAWLSAPAAIEFISQWGLQDLMDRNHQMAAWAHQMLCSRWDVKPCSPLDGSLLGSMAMVELPVNLTRRFDSPEHLMEVLYDRFSIEVPIKDHVFEQWLLRVSCQIYNEPDDYHVLADAITELVNE